MITEIQIENFQAHKDSVITFDGGVNVITGTSDVGKSSITRLIEWVVMNRPSGEEFKNWDTPKKGLVVGQIIFNDGFILKERGKENTYETLDGGLKALRTDLPPEITDVTQMSEINIQSQHSPYFLIGEKPAEVTRKLNEIVGLTVIDRLFGNINKRLYALRTNLKYEEKGIAQDREEIARLTPYRKLKEKFDRCIEVVKERDELNRKRIELESSLLLIRDTIEKKEKYSGYPAVEQRVNNLASLINDFDQKSREDKGLSVLLEGIGGWKESLAHTKTWLRFTIPVDKLSSQIGSMQELGKQAFQLEVCLKKIRKEIEKKQEWVGIISEYQDKYRKALVEAKVCPTCLRPVTKAEAEKIVRELA